MTSYTNDWGLPKPDGSDLIAGSTENLRRDLSALADKTDQQLTQAVAQTLDSVSDQYVAGTEVRRVITSKNPYLTISPGDLHLIEATPKFFTMFHDTPVGHHPAGLTAEWNPTEYTVIEDDTALGGKLLRVTASASRPHLLARDYPEGLDDPKISEIVFKWRADSQNTAPRPTHRASGGPGTENGYYSLIRVTDELTTGHQVNGSGATVLIGVQPLDFEPGRWYITRSRQQESSYYVSVWPADEPEPDSWMLTRRDHDMFPEGGWTGLYVRGSGTVDIDWVGIGYDTGAAPTPEV